MTDRRRGRGTPIAGMGNPDYGQAPGHGSHHCVENRNFERPRLAYCPRQKGPGLPLHTAGMVVNELLCQMGA